jgi:predicted nucleic acid-binding protein
VIRAYFDSSAIIKLTRAERESQGLIEYLKRDDVEASTSVLAEVEVVRNLNKLRLDSAGAMRGFYLLAFDADVRDASLTLGSTLKSLDAIHVASALAIGDATLEFITYDEQQAAAARDAGLRVVQPGRSA